MELNFKQYRTGKMFHLYFVNGDGEWLIMRHYSRDKIRDMWHSLFMVRENLILKQTCGIEKDSVNLQKQKHEK